MIFRFKFPQLRLFAQIIWCKFATLTPACWLLSLLTSTVSLWVVMNIAVTLVPWVGEYCRRQQYANIKAAATRVNVCLSFTHQPACCLFCYITVLLFGLCRLSHWLYKRYYLMRTMLAGRMLESSNCVYLCYINIY